MQLLTGKLSLTLATSPEVVRPVARSLSAMLSGLLHEEQLKRMELAFQEMLRNAYEHGNLGVSGEEKAALLAAGTFGQVLNGKADAARKAGKVIVVEAEISKGHFTCLVRDMGVGFDRSKIEVALHPGSDPSSHGRGLAIIEMSFDKVTYCGTGNEIRVEKKLR